MNKDRLVALGIEDRHRLRKRRFIEKIRRGSVAPLPAKTNRGCCAVFLGFPLTNTPSPNAQQLKRNQPCFTNICQYKYRLSLHCSIDTGCYSKYCKRLPSHIGQEQACSRITWLWFVCLSPCQKWPNTKENGY